MALVAKLLKCPTGGTWYGHENLTRQGNGFYMPRDPGAELGFVSADGNVTFSYHVEADGSLSPVHAELLYFGNAFVGGGTSPLVAGGPEPSTALLSLLGVALAAVHRSRKGDR